MFVIFRCFTGSSTVFSSVLVKVHDSKHWLTQKILKMYLYKDWKDFHWKTCFFRFYSCYNSYFQIFCHKEDKFADLLCLFTYIDYVSSFVSGSFRRTITYIKGLWSFTRTEILFAANIHFVGNLSISKTFCKDNVAGKNEENRISLYVIIWRQINKIWLTCCGCCCNSFGINDFINFFHSTAPSIYTMMAPFTSHVATQLCHSCNCKIIYI